MTKVSIFEDALPHSRKVRFLKYCRRRQTTHFQNTTKCAINAIYLQSGNLEFQLNPDLLAEHLRARYIIWFLAAGELTRTRRERHTIHTESARGLSSTPRQHAVDLFLNRVLSNSQHRKHQRPNTAYYVPIHFSEHWTDAAKWQSYVP